MLDENRMPKVSGYGLQNFKTSSQELVPSYDFWETWTYMSPEQKAQGELATESDVYFMGVDCSAVECAGRSGGFVAAVNKNSELFYPGGDIAHIPNAAVTVESYGFGLNLLNSLYTCLYVAILVSEFLNILEEIIGYIEFSIMVNESEVIVGGGSSSGVTAGAIDWTTYSFPQAVELTGLPEKFNGGIGFSRWQKRMKLWLTIKGLWPVVEYEKPVVDQEKADTVKAFAKWAEKDGVARAAILAALTNTLFDVYSSDAYSAKLLWEKLDQTHNTDSQGLEKYSVARFLEFKLVDNKSMTEQVHEFEMIVHALKESGMNLPEKFKVMSVIEKLPKSWEEFSLSLKRQKGEITWTNLMLDISVQEQHKSKQGHVMPTEHGTSKVNIATVGQKRKAFAKKANSNKPKSDKDKAKKPKANKPCWSCGQVGHWSKDCPTKKAKKTEVAQANVVLGTASGPVVNMVVIEATASETNVDRYVSYNPVIFSTYLSNEWLIDTGANVHICADISLFVSYQQSHSLTVKMGNASVAQVHGVGNVDLKFPSGRILSLTRVHHVPNMCRNIISGSCLVSSGFEISFKCNKVVLIHTGTFFGKGYLSNGLFVINVDPVLGSLNNNVIPTVNCIESSNIWHARLGHLNFGALKNMMNLELIPKYTIEKNSKCQVCVSAKQIRKPFHNVVRDSDLLDLVHTDICEFGGVLTKDQFRYFITFIDDSSRYCYVYLLRHKDEALSKFIIYKTEVEKQTSKLLKRLRSDRGGEYTSNAFNEFCANNGIVHEVTPPYTPESNGVAERKNRTFKDMINSMLINSGLPKYMWGEALNTACHILNRVPLKHMDKTPLELWKGRMTSLKYLRVWGCLAKVLVPEHKRKKLGPKTVDCIFLGYLETTTAMRFLVLKSDIDGIVANTIVEFRDATFFEDVYPMKTGIPETTSEEDPTHTSSSIPDHVEKMTNVGAEPSSSSIPKELEEPRRSKRAKIVKDFGGDFITYNIEDEPLTFRQAMDSSESRHWKGAVKSEIDSIVSNGTWELVDLPPGCSTIGCKWVFKRKLNPDGSIDKYKARLVAKGFKQKEGIDYCDTYSPVARMVTIRMLIALASVHGLIIHQMDVKTAFLHGELEEEIYMDQPDGFVASGNERKVCKLIKSIYGLKQAPRDWHKKFDETILPFSYKINESDKCVYTKVKGNECVILCLYVDDILLFGTNIEIINETKEFLKRHFEMKDMGEASVILGIKLIQSTEGITLTQSHYIEKSILEKYGYSQCRIASTPYDSKVALVKNTSGVPVSQLRYSQIIGSLQYLANCTRPDISYSVSKLARYTSCPNRTHWDALDRVLRYLKGTMYLSLHYRRFPGVLEGYSDASWIAKKSGSNGVTGYVFTLAGGAISWKSSRQTIVTRSTFEAELCALDATGTEAEWLHGLMSAIPVVSRPLPAIAIHCDSRTTIDKISSKKHNAKTKRHIQVRLKSIRGLVTDRIIAIEFIGTQNNIADPLTKGLEPAVVLKSRLGMGLSTHHNSSTVGTQYT
ncbi:hypothetical protein AgCh_012369 [Apium graveolens]